MLNRFFIVVILIANTLCLMGQEVSGSRAERVVLDKVIAVVGSSSILYSDVQAAAEQVIQQRRSQGYSTTKEPFTEALELLMEQKLLYNQGLVDSVYISTIDIENSVERYIQSLLSQEGGVIEVERKYGIALYNIRDNVRYKERERAYAQSMRQQVVSDVSVTPGDVTLFYKGKDKDSLPVIGEQYVYAQITRYPSSIDAAKVRVRERLLDMRERIISGSISFDALARMYSVDPGSAYRGGELEPSTLNYFDSNFADMLSSLQPGQVSEIVESEFGFHIIELIDKKGNLYHARHILLRPVYTDEELREPTIFLDSLALQIKADSITFEQAAKLHSDDPHSKMNGGIVSNHDILEKYNAYDAKLTVTRFLKEDFGNRGYKSIDDYVAISRLNKGEISPAFATADVKGDNLSKIVKLVDVIPSHTASLGEDYLRIEDMALEAKQMSEYDSWLKKRIDAFYVYISPEYRSLDFTNKNWVK